MTSHLLPPIRAYDPGHNGAAVQLSPSGRLARAWRWSDRRDRKGSPGYDLIEIDERGVARSRLRGASLRVIGEVIAAEGRAVLEVEEPIRVVVEGLFAGKNGASSLDLAESAGRLLGDLVPDWRPRWVVWARIIVGGEVSTKTVNPARAGWLAVQGVIAHESDLSDDHVLDAACMAVWGRITERAARMAASQTKAPERGQRSGAGIASKPKGQAT